MKKMFLVAAITWLSCPALPLNAAPSEIYLVRHAEKLKSVDKDPQLSPCGLAQAKAMARLITSTLATIYHSGYQRTKQTAEQLMLVHPSARITSYDAGDLPALVHQLQQQKNAVLIVGHSNTTPELIHLLSDLPAPQMTEQDYGVVYRLKLSEQGYLLSSDVIQQPSICIPLTT